MKKTAKSFRLLVLTDHSNHSAEEALYMMLKVILQQSVCKEIFVASRGNPANNDFFLEMKTTSLAAVKITEDFTFVPNSKVMLEQTEQVQVDAFDWVWLRMPKPNPRELFAYIESLVKAGRIINRPLGILETGSKAFLLNFKSLCPPMKLCYTLEEVMSFKSKFPIVLKPFGKAGGLGLVRIDGNTVWEGEQTLSLEAFLPELENQLQYGYLAMKYLPRVSEGDKRIIVVNGQITGTALRVPKSGSWLANVAQGASSVATKIDKEEISLVKKLHPVLSKHGVIFYGIDTLVNDKGKRVLSEINTSSAGGIYPAQQLSGEPVVERSAMALYHYMVQRLD